MTQLSLSQGKYLELSGKTIPEYLTREEIEKLIKVVKKPHHHLLINFLWQTGARISEALAVEVKDIDFNSKEIKLITLKRKKITYRSVPLTDKLQSELAGYLYQKNLREGKIFKFSRQNAWAIIRKYFKLADINKKPHPHIFRHSFAFNCSSQGLHPRLLQRLLGHSNIVNTSIYYNPTQEFLKEQFLEIKF